MKKFIIYVALAIAATLPGLVIRFAGIELAPLVATCIFFGARLGAGFLLSRGLEAAGGHVSQGLAIAVLALITVLPEYAVDIYLSYQAGAHFQPAARRLSGKSNVVSRRINSFRFELEEMD